MLENVSGSCHYGGSIAVTAETTGSTVGPFLGELDDRDMRWFLGQRTWIRATAAQTGGSLGVVEQVLSAGDGSPYHVHHAQDEAFYVIDGQIRFFSGDQSRVLGPGGFASLPRDVPHGFRVEGSASARILILSTPAGFEGFVADQCDPEPPTGAPDLAELTRVAAQHGIEILGPLPE